MISRRKIVGIGLTAFRFLLNDNNPDEEWIEEQKKIL
jgi:hypothetical protein